MNEVLFRQLFKNKYLLNKVLSFVPLINKSQYVDKGSSPTEKLLPSFGIKKFGSASNLCKHKCFRLLHYIIKLPENVKDQMRREHGLHCDLFMMENVIPFLECCNDYQIFLDFYTRFPEAFKLANMYYNDTLFKPALGSKGTTKLAFESACLPANFEIIRHLSRDGFKADKRSGQTLINILSNKNCSMELLKYIVEELKVTLITPEAKYLAIESGRIEVIEYIYVNCKIDRTDRMPNPLDTTTQKCQQLPSLQVVEFICTKDPKAIDINDAIDQNRLDIFIYMCEHFRELVQLEKVLIERVCSSGALDVLKYIHQKLFISADPVGYFVDLNFMRNAVNNGHLEIVKFLTYDFTVKSSSYVMDLAAAKGYFEIVQFLHESRTDGCSISAMDGAIKNGHLKIIEFLHNHRTEGASPNIIDYASQIGRLDIIKFMIENNRTEGFSGLAINWAVAQGRLDIVQYLTPHLSKDTRAKMAEAVVNAAHIGSVDILDWLVEHGYKLLENNCMMAAIGNGHLQVVQYLVNRNNTKIAVTAEQVSLAIEENRVVSPASLKKLYDFNHKFHASFMLIDHRQFMIDYTKSSSFFSSLFKK
ncbi:hypothetical protein DFA_03280 [Cavenderia fasciculata]|uniref:Ankyrin repeat-containing protein n=1 Tax=Cavenderia fasciculata TaxID=261658 RepID=F4PH50_CACFS|nr:uncharacterized protein DFA_03280 [Cavenderia fasciculata]EGG25034.1 hypothetical protein DFA_03280 [Cavenderia fasciculata]|eukprot:XP_004362885.1 hypothetical protein DFA_03280 [Cavenderia fasciculata]